MVALWFDISRPSVKLIYMKYFPRNRAVYLSAVILLCTALMPAFGMRGLVAAGEEVARPVRVIEITAKRFEFKPRRIRLKKDVPVLLEVRTADVTHGFNCPEMGFRANITPGMVAKISFTPIRAGEFEFFCDIFCGKGHDKMTGKFIVEE